MTKQYKVTNVRESYRGEIEGTVRQDTLASVLRNYTDAVTVWKTGFHPPRFEFNHQREYNRLQEIKEETDQPGRRISALDLAAELDEFDYRCVAQHESDGTQTIRVSGTMRTYQVDVDTSVVEWAFPEEVNVQ